MKDADEVVDQVLAGLRASEAPEGLEARLLARVRERQADARLVGESWFASMGAWAVRGALAAALAAFWIGWVVVRHQPMVSPVVQTPLAAAATAGPAVGRQTGRETDHGAMKLKRRASDVRVAEPQRAREISLSDAAEVRVAMVSFPAPPLPLTQQEQLLLRVVHKGDEVQVAMLRLGEGAPWSAEAKAEFDRFFTEKPKEIVNANEVR